MFKISIAEARSRRRLILEGQLLPPWIGELKERVEKGRARNCRDGR
jgi:hypothetical protein